MLSVNTIVYHIIKIVFEMLFVKHINQISYVVLHNENCCNEAKVPRLYVILNVVSQYDVYEIESV